MFCRCEQSLIFGNDEPLPKGLATKLTQKHDLSDWILTYLNIGYQAGIRTMI